MSQPANPSNVPSWDEPNGNNFDVPPRFSHCGVGQNNSLADIKALSATLQGNDITEEYFNPILYPSDTVDTYSKWLAEVHSLVQGNQDLRGEFDRIQRLPDNYSIDDCCVLVICKFFLWLWNSIPDKFEGFKLHMWLIRYSPLKYYRKKQMPVRSPYHSFALVSLIGGLLHIELSPDAKDLEEFSVAHYAVTEKRFDVLYLLSRWGADFNCSSLPPISVTPLQRAIEMHDDDWIRKFIELGSSTEAPNKKGKTPLMHLMQNYNRYDTIQLLLEKGAQLTSCDEGGNTVLHYAVIGAEPGVPSEAISELKNSVLKDIISKQNSSGDTPLHCAVKCNKSEVVMQLLDVGADPEISNNSRDSPLDLAAERGQVEVFECLLNRAVRHTDSRSVANMRITLEEYIAGGHLKSATDYIQSLPKTRSQFCFSCEPKLPGDNDESMKKHMLQNIVKLKPHDTAEKLVRTVLDKCCYGNGKVIRVQCMETDDNGSPPNSAYHYEQKKKHSFLSQLSENDNMFRKLALHPSIRALLKHKWQNFGLYYFWLYFFWYALRMVMLTLALGIAARPSLVDPRHYQHGLDIFRGVCEGITLLIVLINILTEVYLFICTMYRNIFNYIEWLAILFTLILIPLRVYNLSEQWIIASLAFFFHGIRVFHYAVLLRPTGVYVSTLWYILIRDIFKFLTVFLLVLLLFMGCLALAMKEDLDITYKQMHNNGTSSNTGNSETGSLFYYMYYYGIRTMIESSSILDYGKFRWLSVLTYLIFLFVVVTVLLNVLIAQMNFTYTNVQSSALVSHLYYQACFINIIEKELHFPYIITGSKRRKPIRYKELIWTKEETNQATRSYKLRNYLKKFFSYLVSANETRTEDVTLSDVMEELKLVQETLKNQQRRN